MLIVSSQVLQLAKELWVMIFTRFYGTKHFYFATSFRASMYSSQVTLQSIYRKGILAFCAEEFRCPWVISNKKLDGYDVIDFEATFHSTSKRRKRLDSRIILYCNNLERETGKNGSRHRLKEHTNWQCLFYIAQDLGSALSPSRDVVVRSPSAQNVA